MYTNQPKADFTWSSICFHWFLTGQIVSGACVSAESTPWSEDGGGEFPVPSGATGSHLKMKLSECMKEKVDASHQFILCFVSQERIRLLHERQAKEVDQFDEESTRLGFR